MNDASTPSLFLTSHQPEDTARWATALTDIAVPGRVVCLWGDVGAGKTFFARCLIQALQARHGTPEDVPSPTFTLVQTYDAGDLEIWHADLYRLSGPQEVYELGLIAAFETAFCLVEWPDRLGDLIPKGALHMTFSHAEGLEDRHCKITSSDLSILEQTAQLLKANTHE
jgi:tRNA threonylcarbamoyladenosine biosynthesis protein TsaE